MITKEILSNAIHLALTKHSDEVISKRIGHNASAMFTRAEFRRRDIKSIDNSDLDIFWENYQNSLKADLKRKRPQNKTKKGQSKNMAIPRKLDREDILDLIIQTTSGKIVKEMTLKSGKSFDYRNVIGRTKIGMREVFRLYIQEGKTVEEIADLAWSNYIARAKKDTERLAAKRASKKQASESTPYQQAELKTLHFINAVYAERFGDLLGYYQYTAKRIDEIENFMNECVTKLAKLRHEQEAK